MHNLLSFWDSLSLVQRKTRAVKQRCVDTVEGQMLAIIAAQTAQSPALPGEGGDEAPEE